MKTPQPFLLLALLALGVLVVPVPTPAPVERTVRIEATSFAFTPGEIRVNPGDRVTLQLVSTDVVHGLSLDGYGLHLTADPGQPASLTFTAGKSGTFRFRCQITCGPLHPFMIGKLSVGPNLLFWRGLGLAGLAVAFGSWKSRP